MKIAVEPAGVIRRNRSDVAAFMLDPATDATARPFPMRIRNEMVAVPDGMRATIRAQGDAAGVCHAVASLLAGAVGRHLATDLRALKRLEAAPARRE
jgi:hypothetical protein